jgi:hypothetical protein
MTTIVVAGLGRCGTSLTMRMLATAGFPTVGTAPDYEVEEVQDLLERGELVKFGSFTEGRAVKILDPHRWRMPSYWGEVRVIFLKRDPVQQAKSQLKLLSQAFGAIDTSRASVRALARSMALDTRPALRAVSALGPVPPLVLDFEALITKPTTTAVRICHHLGMDTEQEVGANTAIRMAAQVIQRPVSCLPYMLEAGMVR